MTDPFEGLVRQYVKPGEDILAAMTPEKAHLLHMAIGVTGEAGELGDAIKRFAIYGKELDRANVVEELADLRFFMTGIMVTLGITEDELIHQEHEKLGKRYASGGYSDQQAQDRADKAIPVMDAQPQKNSNRDAWNKLLGYKDGA